MSNPQTAPTRLNTQDFALPTLTHQEALSLAKRAALGRWPPHQTERALLRVTPNQRALPPQKRLFTVGELSAALRILHTEHPNRTPTYHPANPIP